MRIRVDGRTACVLALRFPRCFRWVMGVTKTVRVLLLVLVLIAGVVPAERTGPMAAFFARFSLAVERGEPETHALLEDALNAWLDDGTRPPPSTCATPVCLPLGSPCDPNSTYRFCIPGTCLLLSAFFF